MLFEVVVDDTRRPMDDGHWIMAIAYLEPMAQVRYNTGRFLSASEFLCCYFCESLFFGLPFNFVFYVFEILDS